MRRNIYYIYFLVKKKKLKKNYFPASTAMVKHLQQVGGSFPLTEILLWSVFWEAEETGHEEGSSADTQLRI